MAAPKEEHVTYIPNDYSIYRPLRKDEQEIRLLRIKTEAPGSTARVACYLTYASLLDPRVPNAYTCLSYCWGDTRTTTVIDVVRPDKCLHDGTCEGKVYSFNVTVNLEVALRTVRSMTERPLIWVDAVCINQSDLVERGHQVSIMQNIYSKSMQTLIWLGDADSHSDLAMDFALFIRKLLAGLVDLKSGTFRAGIHCSRLRGLLRGDIDFNREEVSHREFIAMREATQSLFSRPWFRRAWVLQEVSRSSAVVAIAGSIACQWEDIRNLGTWENRATLSAGDVPWADYQLPTVCLPVLPDVTRDNDLPEIWWFLARECKNGAFPSILELIFRRIQIQATDPRDQVFALFSIARECQSQENKLDGFRPNYLKMTAEVYADFTRAVIMSTRSLVVLSAVDTFLNKGKRERRDLPTWVPDYSHHFNLRRSIAFIGSSELKAAGKTAIEIGIKDAFNSLMLRGVVIDEVGYVQGLEGEAIQVRRTRESSVRNVIFNASMNGIRDLWQVIRDQDLRLHDKMDILEAFILTLLCSRKDQMRRTVATSVGDIPHLLEDFAAYWRAFEPTFESLPSRSTLYESRRELEVLSTKRSAIEFGKRLMWTCDSRRLLTTKNQSLGLFPKHAQAGDLVAVFFGSSVPDVVRPIEPSLSTVTTCHLIGECYVHGRMDGSVAEDMDAGRLHPRWFDVR